MHMRRSVTFTFMLLFLQIPLNAQPEKGDFFSDMGRDDDNDFFLLSEPSFDDDMSIAVENMRNVTAVEALTFLTQDIIDITTLLQEDLYLRTNNLHHRSLLDIPIISEPLTCRYNSCWTAGAHLFWNQMNRNRFTRKSTKLKDYLGLNQQTLIDKLRAVQEVLGTIDDLKSVVDIDIAAIFDAFADASIQERRIGAMFHLMREGRKSRVRLFFPFYWREKNFYLCQQQRDNAEALLARELGLTQNDEEEDVFAKQHMISDRLGIGDMRIELDTLVVCHHNYTLRLGGLLTIPTAFSFERGLAGTVREACGTLPTFSFSELLCILKEAPDTQARTEGALEILSPFFIGVLDRFGANVFDSRLGNGGHPGVGAIMRSETRLCKILHYFPVLNRLFFWLAQSCWKSRMSLEYLFPKQERRFFIQKNNPEEYKRRNFATMDEDEAADNLAFLDCEFVNKFYTMGLETRVHPGIIFHTNSKFCYEACHWDFFIGTDTWVRTKETYSNIRAPKEITIDVKKARSFLAYQSKGLIGLVYHLERPNKTWHFGLQADGTWASSGIGKDFTIALSLEAHF